MTIDQIIALASSIGACLSAFAAFLAIREVAKQRSFSYRPELAISTTSFSSSKHTLTSVQIPDRWNKNNDPEVGVDFVTGFSIPIRNVGLGAAKSVKIYWSFPIEDFVSTVNKLAQKSLKPAYFEYNNKMLSLKSNGLGESTSMWGNQQNGSIDFILPASVEKNPTELAIPQAYITLVTALIFFTPAEETNKYISSIPEISLELKYFDIGGKEMKARYTLTSNIVAIIGSGESFSGYMEGKKQA